MKLNHKKGCIRRIDIDQNKLSYIWVLCSIRITIQMKEGFRVVNINEVSRNTEMLNRLSWLKVGVNYYLTRNSKDSFYFLSNRLRQNWIGASIYNKLNSNTFVEFLKIINCWFDKILDGRYSKNINSYR